MFAQVLDELCWLMKYLNLNVGEHRTPKIRRARCYLPNHKALRWLWSVLARACSFPARVNHVNRVVSSARHS